MGKTRYVLFSRLLRRPETLAILPNYEPDYGILHTLWCHCLTDYIVAGGGAAAISVPPLKKKICLSPSPNCSSWKLCLAMSGIVLGTTPKLPYIWKIMEQWLEEEKKGTWTNTVRFTHPSLPCSVWGCYHQCQQCMLCAGLFWQLCMSPQPMMHRAHGG